MLILAWDSPKELLKALTHCNSYDRSITVTIDQYAKHIVDFVHYKTGIPPAKSTGTSLITAVGVVGPDLRGNILSFFSHDELHRQMQSACKTFYNIASKVLWQSILL
jgi:hypothetical protein